MTIDIQIRPERPADAIDIRHVTEQAFAGRSYSSGTEHHIVDALRESGALAISLVAEHDGRVVGHVAFSPANPADGTPGWYTLGPVSVFPDVQRQGIGRALISAGIDGLREQRASGCIVVGDTNYYSRFGFVPSPDHSPIGELKQHFMTLSFTSHVPAGVIHFHPVFL